MKKLYLKFSAIPQHTQNLILLLLFFSIFAAFFSIGLTANNFGEHSADKTISTSATSKITVKTFFQILTNNLVCAVLILTGFVTFGISTLFTLMYNGVVIGQGFGYYTFKLGLYKTLLLVVPHGVIELSYLMLLSAFSVHLAIAFGQLLASGLSNKKFFSLLFSSYTLFLLALVVGAAVIEAFITPLIFDTLTPR